MTSDLLPWEGSKDLYLLDGKVCAQHEVVAVPECLPGTSSGHDSWLVLSEGAERDVTAAVGSEMYILRISMSYNSFFFSFKADVWLQGGASEMFLM